MSPAAAAGLLTALAFLVLWHRPAVVRPLQRPDPVARPVDRSRWASPWLASAVTLVSAVAVVGGPTGWLLGAAGAAASHRWVSRLESASATRRRETVVCDLPVVTDLVAACLAAGRSPQASLEHVASAWSGPVADDLRLVLARYRWGADAAAAWQPWLDDEAWAPLAAAFTRSGPSGSSVTSSLGRAAEDLRRRRRWAARARARGVGVRTAAPLGLCFLPAFFLVGVVPMVIGVFSVLGW